MLVGVTIEGFSPAGISQTTILIQANQAELTADCEFLIE